MVTTLCTKCFRDSNLMEGSIEVVEDSPSLQQAYFHYTTMIEMSDSQVAEIFSQSWLPWSPYPRELEELATLPLTTGYRP